MRFAKQGRIMIRNGLALISIGLVLTVGQTAFGLPTYGANCAGCHTGSRGTITITGNSTTANPAEACTVPDRGTLPVFTVAPGGTKALTATLSGITSGAHYALVFKGLESNAVQNCGVLGYSDDATWNKRSSTAPVYYTQPLTGTFYTWPGNASYNYSLVAGAATPADYYDLVFAVAGNDSTGLFYKEAHFYVQVSAPAIPTIALSPTSLTATAVQGSSPSNGSFTVANSGSGTLNYTVTDNATWLSESPTSGSTSGPAVTHTVQYSTASLAAGTYTATITVSDPNASNNPQTISVSLTITAPARPTIALSPTSLTATAVQGSSPANGSFTVANSGGGTLNYTITDNATWLSVSPTSGSTSGPAVTHTVQYSTASLSAGSYSATITVTDANATNSPQTISVSLTITAPSVPAISLNPTTLSATAVEGSSPSDGTFTVANTGGGTLNYSITADATWLTVSPAGGSTTGPANTHAVQYSTSSLTAGSYSATITVSDPNATNDPQTIGVTLTISVPGAEPTIALDPVALSPTAAEGAGPLDDTFTVSNSGGGTLNYVITVAASGQGGGDDEGDDDGDDDGHHSDGHDGGDHGGGGHQDDGDDDDGGVAWPIIRPAQWRRCSEGRWP